MKRALIIVGTSLISLAAGAAGGFLYAKRTLDSKYNEIMEEEIERTKNYYAAFHKREEFSTPEGAAQILLPDGFEILEEPEEEDPLSRREQAERVLYENKYAKPVKQVETNIFDNPNSGSNEEDYQKAVAARTTTEPYVISEEEYMEEENYRQITVTFYEGDEVLVDEQTSEPIMKAEKTLGIKRPPFGQWSNDPNVVYVRNDALEAVFEVLRHQGRYSEVVLGLTPDKKAGR